MSQSTQNIKSRHDYLLRQVVESEGLTSVYDLLEQYVTDSIVPGICINCESIESNCEPDAIDNYCNECKENKVKSILVLAGVI